MAFLEPAADLAGTAVKTVARAALPWWLPWALGAGALALIAGAYFAWQYHQREIGRQEIIAKDAKELADQAERDKKTSQRLVEARDLYIRELESSGGKVREVIRYEKRSDCPPDAALDTVADWVRDALSKTSRPPAGR